MVAALATVVALAMHKQQPPRQRQQQSHQHSVNEPFVRLQSVDEGGRELGQSGVAWLSVPMSSTDQQLCCVCCVVLWTLRQAKRRAREQAAEAARARQEALEKRRERKAAYVAYVLTVS